MVALVLLFLGCLASVAGSEAVLPAYLVGPVLAPTILKDCELPHRLRIAVFSILTPFYFLKAGSLVEARAVVAGGGLIAVLLAARMATKFVGILPGDTLLSVRAARGHVHDPADVDRTDVRQHLRCTG